MAGSEQAQYRALVRKLELDELRTLRPALQELHRENVGLGRTCREAEGEKARLEALLARRREANEQLRLRAEALEQEYRTLLADCGRGTGAVGIPG